MFFFSGCPFGQFFLKVYLYLWQFFFKSKNTSSLTWDAFFPSQCYLFKDPSNRKGLKLACLCYTSEPSREDVTELKCFITLVWWYSDDDNLCNELTMELCAVKPDIYFINTCIFYVVLLIIYVVIHCAYARLKSSLKRGMFSQPYFWSFMKTLTESPVTE